MHRARTLQMRSQLVGPVLAAVRAAGADPEQLVRRFGLPADAESRGEIELPLATLHAFLEAAEEATGDPFLGVHIATRYPRGAFGILEFASRSAPDLREAYARVVQYVSLVNELVDVTLSEREGVASFEWRIAGVPDCVGRHANELLIVALILSSRQLSGTPFVPQRVWFAHERPTDVSELEAALGTSRVAFGVQANGFSLTSSALDAPLASADPPLLAVLDGQARQALEQRVAPDRFVGRVRQLVREGLSAGVPTVEVLAKRLSMSPRTLQRRLTDQATSVQELVESVREEVARLEVSEGKRPLAEIAFLLGYADPRAFLRAFKRWTGKTPAQYRSG